LRRRESNVRTNPHRYTLDPPMDLFSQQLLVERDNLLKVANHRLSSAAWAQDAVSETILAALERQPNIGDPTRLRRWLYGVLHNKVVDQVRRHVGDDLVSTVGDSHDLDALHDANHHGAPDPFDNACHSQFIQSLARELNRLPHVHATAFVMREALDKSADDICRELGLSLSNLWVILHRTRMRLRGSLQAHFT
jgi:RNA polymerase sigma factor (sigma-70 family)